MATDDFARLAAILALLRTGEPGPPGPQGIPGPAGPAGDAAAGDGFIVYGLSQDAGGPTWVTPGYEPNTPVNDFLGAPLPFRARPISCTFASSTVVAPAAPVTLTLTALSPLGPAFLDAATIVIPAGSSIGHVDIVTGVSINRGFAIGLRQLAGNFADLEAMLFHIAFQRV